MRKEYKILKQSTLTNGVSDQINCNYCIFLNVIMYTFYK